MRIYVLMQLDSVEEQKYRSALKSEKEAFQAWYVTVCNGM